MMFSSSSSVERIGVSCFEDSGVEELSVIPDGVRELCDFCFRGCRRLRRMNFRSSSSLERIGFQAFPASIAHISVVQGANQQPRGGNRAEITFR